MLRSSGASDPAPPAVSVTPSSMRHAMPHNPQAASQRARRSEGAASALRATLISAAVLVVCIGGVVLMWWIAFTTMKTALVDNANQARVTHLRAINREIAVLLHSVWSGTTALRSRVRGLELTAETFAHRSTVGDVARAIFPSTDKKGHLASVGRDGSGATYAPFIGQVVVLASAAAPTPNCHASVAGVLRHPSPALSNIYIMDWQYHNRSAVEGDGSTDEWIRHLPVFDHTRLEVGDVLVPNCLEPGAPPPPRCIANIPCEPAMASLWRGSAPRGFDDFRWFGPFDPQLGWGFHLEGNVPLVDATGPKPGRVGTAISLSGLSALLRTQLASGGGVTRGGHALLFSTAGGGAVLATTEGDGLSALEGECCDVNYGCCLDALPPGSVLADAVVAVRLQRGVAADDDRAIALCPEEDFVSDSPYNGRLVNIAPLRTEVHGMPPFEHRWCVLTSVPASNVLGPVAEATRYSVWVAVVGIGGMTAALMLLGGAMHGTRKRNRQLEAEHRRERNEFVSDAIASIGELSHPLVLVSASRFVKAKGLVRHETLRDAGALRILDSMPALREFKKQNAVVFISHQWLGYSHPDPSGTQFKAMKAAIAAVRRLPGVVPPGGELYVWCDYSSIPQSHKGLQSTAVASLPVYASSANVMVVVAPDATHADTRLACNLETYFKRGWCRAELLAKVCGSGVEQLYVTRGTTPGGGGSGGAGGGSGGAGGGSGGAGVLEAYTRDQMQRLSLRVFNGDFVRPTDMEQLVKPVLGLYALALANAHKPHIRDVLAHIKSDKSGFFPDDYAPPDSHAESSGGGPDGGGGAGGGGRVELFRGLVELVEERAVRGMSTTDLRMLRERTRSLEEPRQARGAGIGALL